MDAIWLCKHKLLAALLLCSTALMGQSALGYTDTTPYGLIYASGTVTDINASVDNYVTKAGTQHQISVAFFNPPSAPATSGWSITGWLPGSVTVKNPDGSTVVDAENFSPSLIFFPWFAQDTGPTAAFIQGNITYKGAPATLTVYIQPVGSYANWFPNTSVMISISQTVATPGGGSTQQAVFAAWGSLSGFSITDP